MALDLSAQPPGAHLGGSLAVDAGQKQQRQSLALGHYLEESAEYEQWARATDLSRETAAWLLARPIELEHQLRPARLPGRLRADRHRRLADRCRAPSAWPPAI
ncbi:MAG: hypothetical protein U0Z44_06260 [Kouleothrix sp.]